MATATPEEPGAEVENKSAGQRLVEELTKPADSYALTFLIEQVGHVADYLERLHALHSGDADAWLRVKIGAKTVEVVVNDPLREARMQSEQVRRLLAEIHRQRAQLPGDPNDDGDPLDRY